MIFAYPGETEKDQRESVDMIMDICRRYPGAEFWTNIFSPYPGAPVMERAFELGIHVPKTFEEWSDFFPRYQVLPWMNGKKQSACKPCASTCGWRSTDRKSTRLNSSHA